MTRRRAPGEGTIAPYETGRGIRYRATWRDPAGQRRTSGGFTTQAEAAAHLLAVRTATRGAEGGPGAFPEAPQEGLTLAAHMDTWLAGHRASPSTLAGYQRLWRLHLAPTLQEVVLGALRPAQLAAVYRTLEASGLGPGTIRKAHDLLSVALGAALADGLITTNPARHPGAQPPRGREVREARPDIQVWDTETLAAFLTWARDNDPDMHTAWVILAATGIRRSELLGLRWGDVDLTGAVLHVRRAIVDVQVYGEAGYLHTGVPKGGRGRRIDIDLATVQVLREWRAHLASLDLRRAAPDQPVVTLRSGQPVHPDRLTRRWTQAVARYRRTRPGAPALHLHGLRHTHATTLLSASVPPQVVADRLGHDIGVLLHTYAHVIPGQGREVAALVGRLLAGGG